MDKIWRNTQDTFNMAVHQYYNDVDKSTGKLLGTNLAECVTMNLILCNIFIKKERNNKKNKLRKT